MQFGQVIVRFEEVWIRDTLVIISEYESGGKEAGRRLIY